MWLIWTLIIGLFIGIVAKFLMPGRDPGGFFITALLGVAGAMLAGFLGRQLGWYAESQAAGFVASVLGAMLLLFVYRMVGRRV